MQLPKVIDPHKKDISANQMVQSQEIHCPICGRFIGYQAIVWGIVKILCPNCKEWVTIEVMQKA